MKRPSVPVLVAAAVSLAFGALAATAYAPGTVVCRFKDAVIKESSGVAASSVSDDLFFTHNDSGGEPCVYAFDRRGETLAVLRVPEAKNIDWEDMARGPDDNGELCLFVGDIGDNAARRSHVSVYRFPEPDVDPGKTGVATDTAPAARFDLHYPDGPHDAETLLVHPRTGQLFIVTKGLQGSALYAAPRTLQPGKTNRMTKVASVSFNRLSSSVNSLGDAVRRLLCTGGALSPDGTRLVLRTYTDAYGWKIPNGNIAAVFGSQPARIVLPETRQGEAITYSHDGASLITTTEGANAPVHELKGN